MNTYIFEELRTACQHHQNSWSGMLEHAAQSKKPEVINFYFSEMNESCASCHAVFATHKFPALKPAEKDGHAH